MNWEPVIGLEVHVQLMTKSKIFSGASTAYGAEPNTQACTIDLALPGVLPVLNEAALRMAIKFGLAIEAQLHNPSVFARKNYFYPDLPKGYQISQFDLPIVGKGQLEILLENGEKKIVGITRAHLEEDAGKSLHDDLAGISAIDLNRAGTPLLEIVSEPELYSPKEAVAYLKALYTLVTYLKICDGNLQEGSFRCDANVSVRPVGSQTLGTRAEIKNINSFRFVEKAIQYEIARQIQTLEDGGKILQETRLYDAEKDETRSMRLKENAHDYRYFPDPDLLPVFIPETLLQEVQADLPELPWEKRERLIQKVGLSAYEADILVSNPTLCDYFEQVMASTQANPKQTANWILGDFSAALNRDNLSLSQSPVSPTALAQLLDRLADNTLSGKLGKIVFEAMWAGEGTADEIIKTRGLKQVTDAGALEQMVDEIIARYPQQLAEYRQGKEKLFGFFVGEAMKASKGKANPQQLNEILLKKL